MLIDNLAINPASLDAVILQRFLWWSRYDVHASNELGTMRYHTAWRRRKDYPVDVPLSMTSKVMDDICVAVGVEEEDDEEDYA